MSIPWRALIRAYGLTMAALAVGGAITFVLVGPALLLDHDPSDSTSAWAIARPWLTLAATVALIAPPFMVWGSTSSRATGLGLISVAVAAVPVSVISFFTSKVTTEKSTFGLRDVFVVWMILTSSALAWRRREQGRREETLARVPEQP